MKYLRNNSKIFVLFRFLSFLNDSTAFLSWLPPSSLNPAAGWTWTVMMTIPRSPVLAEAHNLSPNSEPPLKDLHGGKQRQRWQLERLQRVAWAGVVRSLNSSTEMKDELFTGCVAFFHSLTQTHIIPVQCHPHSGVSPATQVFFFSLQWGKGISINIKAQKIRFSQTRTS